MGLKKIKTAFQQRTEPEKASIDRHLKSKEGHREFFKKKRTFAF